MLAVESLTVRYGRRLAVDDVSWQLEEGFHALLGPNGAGKSSLLRTIATLQKPSRGSISVGGLSGARSRAQIGYLAQDNLGRSRFTVKEHLTYICWLRQLPPAQFPAEVDRLIALAGLEDRGGTRIGSLSGGIRRRVGIASALVGSPALILLDEPTAGLDVAQRAAHQEILRRAAHDSIVVISTHIVEGVIDSADTLTVMKEGRFCYSGSWEDFGAERDLQSVNRRYLGLVTT